jgi:serine/threonine protein kinase
LPVADFAMLRFCWGISRLNRTTQDYNGGIDERLEHARRRQVAGSKKLDLACEHFGYSFQSSPACPVIEGRYFKHIPMSDPGKTIDPSPETPRVAHALKPGDAIMEYVIERTLGGGGFGITYLARDKNLNLPVAIKEYLPGDMALRTGDNSVHPLGERFEDQFKWGLERFLDEARVLATFRHPNIVRVLRYFLANGTGYIVMEYESGKSLKQWPQREGLSQRALLRLLFPLLDGLEVIHAADFLHRDIKPDNIYIRDDGTPVLIDFGSARSTNSDRELTNVVTPGFAPFEQYHSKGHQGPWTDLYSLAAVVYWLVSGAKPLDSLSRLKQDSMVPTAQLDHHGRFDEALLQAFDWALNPEEKQRPQNVAEFRKRLKEAAGDVTQFPPTSVSQEAGSFSNRVTTGAEMPTGNLVCSILFTDIVAYSQTSVNQQFELKTRFNSLIAEKLAHIPENTRITLDTGDGAAVCFMGDPEEVLLSAIEIKEALQKQDSLLVRMGLHIGPVRIINDLNGRSNVIGDGINVAQRVMSFADSNTLLVSRAFYEIVARLTDRSARSFEYLGERRDKHDRAHELYIVGADNTAGEENEKTILFSSVPDEKTILFNAGVDADKQAVVAAVDSGVVDLDLTGGGGTKIAVLKLKVAANRVKEEVASRVNKEAAIRVTNDLTTRAKNVYANWIKPASLFVWNELTTWSDQNFWWKQALATLCAYCIGWLSGGVVWGAVAGLLASIPGWIRFVRRTNLVLKKNPQEENGGNWIFARTTWIAPDARNNSIVVLPSLAMIVILWAVVPSDVHSHAKNIAQPENPPAVESEKQNPIQNVIQSTFGVEHDAETHATLKKAQKMLDVKNYSEAIGLSRAVLKKHPDNAHAQTILKEAKAARAAKKKRKETTNKFLFQLEGG